MEIENQPRLKKVNLNLILTLACFKRSDSGERCEVKKVMKSRTAPHYLNAWNRLF